MEHRNFWLPLLMAICMVHQPGCAMPADPAAAEAAKLTEAHGETFKRGFVDWTKETWGEPEPAKKGDRLHEGMQLGTGKKSWAQVSWPHVTTRAWADSVFAVAPNQRLVFLMNGEMLFNLSKHRKDKRDFIVWTKVLQARIRGTTVLVQSIGNRSRLTVLEGTVDAMNRLDRSVVRLTPGVIYEIETPSATEDKRHAAAVDRVTTQSPFGSGISAGQAEAGAGQVSSALSQVSSSSDALVAGTTGGLFGTAGGGLSKTVSGAVSDVTGLLGGATSDLTGLLGGATSDLTGLLGGATSDLTGLLGGATSDLTGLLGGATSDLTGTLGGATADFSGLLGRSVPGVTEGLGAEFSSPAGFVEGAASGLSGLLDRSAAGVAGLPGVSPSASSARPEPRVVAAADQCLTCMAGVPIFETPKSKTTLYLADSRALASHPLVTQFETPLESLPLIKSCLLKIKSCTDLKAALGDDGSLARTVARSAEILRVPTATTYKVGTQVGTALPYPDQAFGIWTPIGYIGQPLPVASGAGATQATAGGQPGLDAAAMAGRTAAGLLPAGGIVPGVSTTPGSGSLLAGGTVAGIAGTVAGVAGPVTGAVAPVTGAIGSITGAVAPVMNPVSALTNVISAVTSPVTTPVTTVLPPTTTVLPPTTTVLPPTTTVLPPTTTVLPPTTTVLPPTTTVLPPTTTVLPPTTTTTPVTTSPPEITSPLPVPAPLPTGTPLLPGL